MAEHDLKIFVALRLLLHEAQVRLQFAPAFLQALHATRELASVHVAFGVSVEQPAHALLDFGQSFPQTFLLGGCLTGAGSLAATLEFLTKTIRFFQ